jgi:hypothetical protein
MHTGRRLHGLQAGRVDGEWDPERIDTPARPPSAGWVHVEDNFAIAIPTTTPEEGRRSLDRRVVHSHFAEDLLGKPHVSKASPPLVLEVASLGTTQSFEEFIPTGMAGQNWS